MFDRTRQLSAALCALSTVVSLFVWVVLPVSTPASAYASRGPIYIDGDAGFTPANGMTKGSGTTADPFVIEGWEIAPIGSNAIEVRNTRSHFVIRNVFVHGASFGYAGVWLADLSNATVENVTASDSWAGIVVSYGANVVVAASNLSRNGDGISVMNSVDVSIVRNRVALNASAAGISVTATEGFSVIGNAVTDTKWGILVQWQSRGDVRGNDVRNTTSIGIRLYQTPMANVSVFHNRVVDNAIQAEDDGGPQNRWDEGYPSGGNSWSDYSGIDNCSGPQQDVCPDPDGIGDTPYVIDADTRDRYPIVSTPGTDRPPSPPVLLRVFLAGVGLVDVDLTWNLSSDDRGGERDILAYEIWAGISFSSNGSGYSVVERLPRGTTGYTHAGAGVGNQTAIFYEVVAIDLGGMDGRSAQQGAKFVRFVGAGANLLSVPLEQEEWNVTTVLRTVSWRWARTFVNAFGTVGWISNVNTKAWTDFTSLNRTLGFWLNATAASWWVVAGLVPNATDIVLSPGWNLIGYPSFVPRTVGQLLAGVTFRQVEGFIPSPPYFLRRLSLLDVVAAGDGFWVWVSGPAVKITIGNY